MERGHVVGFRGRQSILTEGVDTVKVCVVSGTVVARTARAVPVSSGRLFAESSAW